MSFIVFEWVEDIFIDAGHSPARSQQPHKYQAHHADLRARGMVAVIDELAGIGSIPLLEIVLMKMSILSILNPFRREALTALPFQFSSHFYIRS